MVCLYCYYSINDVTQTMVDLAGESGTYSYEVFDPILEEEDQGNVGPGEWTQDTRDRFNEISGNCLHKAGLYVRGFIKEFY